VYYRTTDLPLPNTGLIFLFDSVNTAGIVTSKGEAFPEAGTIRHCPRKELKKPQDKVCPMSYGWMGIRDTTDESAKGTDDKARATQSLPGRDDLGLGTASVDFEKPLKMALEPT
jgi:hypothetical protein